MATSTWHTWLYLGCIALAVVNVGCEKTPKHPCPCHEVNGCYRPMVLNTDKEVIVVTDGRSNFSQWSWNSVTTVLATEENTNTDVMCYAHQKKKRYGFKVTVKYGDHFNLTNNVTTAWMKSVVERRMNSHADIVAIDLMDTFMNMDNQDVDKLKSLLYTLKDKISPKIHLGHPVELICVVPWQPPYYEDQSITQDTLYHVCDWLMLDANSFGQIGRSTCRAQATVPYVKVALGVDEYVSEGIVENRIILGVPWHGYQYYCLAPFHYAGDSTNSICLLDNTKKNANNKTYCAFEDSRKLITVGEIVDSHWEDMKKSSFSAIYKAPSYVHYDNKTKQFSQVWFEDMSSLRLKYQYAHDFDLKGVALYYAEDLSKSKTAQRPGYNNQMWSWVLHDILHTDVQTTPPPQYHPDVVAGAAIGCLLLGLVLGIIFTCLALRHRVKKKEVPFKRDRMEYHDDEDLNL